MLRVVHPSREQNEASRAHSHAVAWEASSSSLVCIVTHSGGLVNVQALHGLAGPVPTWMTQALLAEADVLRTGRKSW
jgi:hypothetical protein